MRIERKDTIAFTVDSQLLKELGERLVGKPYIALAELVKNSYDADATNVTISIDKGKDEIVVNDNGHGMTFEEFKNYWMRIGSTHKREMRISRKLKRIMTGSKGVGRLSVQFLAKTLEIATCSVDQPDTMLRAKVDWYKAIETGELTEVQIKYQIEKEGDFRPGTMLVLGGLNSEWSEKDIIGLASQIWWLQQPFRQLQRDAEEKDVFEISLVSHPELVRLYDSRMKAILDIWNARLVGTSENGEVSLSIEWSGQKPQKFSYKKEHCKLVHTDFEIRIYHLFRRQPRGIRVNEAREYLNVWGGVHIFDSGFRLPYYGDPKNDWLKIEFDHSHRLSASQLLPEEIVKGLDRGMQFLPTLSRILGIVNINTRREEDLEILVTRDRLRETDAFDDLVWILRYAIDLYALLEKRRALKASDLTKQIENEVSLSVDDVFDTYESSFDSNDFTRLRKDILLAVSRSKTEAEVIAERVGLVGALATAGITSLAYQHETKRLINRLDSAISSLHKIENLISRGKARDMVGELRNDLISLTKMARNTNLLFSSISSPEDISEKKRLRARSVIDTISNQIGILLVGVTVKSVRIDPELYLPSASIAEWSSIFQNIFLNAYNAMLMSKKKVIDVSSRISGPQREILVQDTGYGIDIDKAEEFFEPFVRETKLPNSLKAAGYGGTGLGLTIVRMISRALGCSVSFVPPEKGYGTAFSLKWRESK